MMPYLKLLVIYYGDGVLCTHLRCVHGWYEKILDIPQIRR